MVKKRYDEGNFPKLYAWCGTDDFLYHISKSFIDYAFEQNIPIIYKEDTGETHSYEYWDKKLCDIVKKMYS